MYKHFSATKSARKSETRGATRSVQLLRFTVKVNCVYQVSETSLLIA